MKKILGLDLGVASLGWAITTINKDGKKEIKPGDFGVRVWDAPIDNLIKGNSNAEAARRYRSSRRLSRRQGQRISDIKRFFVKEKLLTKKEIDNHHLKLNIKGNDYGTENDELNPLKLRLKGITKKITNLELYIVANYFAKHRGYNNMFSTNESDLTEKDIKKIEKDIKEGKKVDAYKASKLNAINAQEKFNTPIEAIAAKNFVFRNKQKPYGSVEIKKSKKEFEKISEYKAYDMQFKKDIVKNEEKKFNEQSVKNAEKHILFTRESIIKEFDIILRNTKLTKIQKEILNTNKGLVFRQRYFEDATMPKNWTSMTSKEQQEYEHKVKSLGQRFYPTYHSTIGKCSFYRIENRVSNLDIYADVWFIVNEITKLTSKLKNDDQQAIVRNVIKTYLLTQKFDLNTIKRIFKNLDIGLPDNYSDIVKGVSTTTTNLFIPSLLKINKEFTMKQLEILDGDISNIKNTKFEEIGNILANVVTPQNIIDSLNNDVEGFVREDTLVNIKKQKWLSGRQNVSVKYIKYVLEKLLNGNEKISIQAMSKELEIDIINKQIQTVVNNFKNSDKDIFKIIFSSNFKDEDMRKNSIVFRSINEIRKTMLALVKKYGNFDSINIEVSTDLYNSKETKDKINSKYKKSQEFNNKIKDILTELEHPHTTTNMNKVKCFLHQQIDKDSKESIKNLNSAYAIELYDINLKSKIYLKTIFTPNYELDHIIPVSSTENNAPDTIWNKVLTTSALNKIKKDRTPLQWFNEQKWKTETWEKLKLNIPKHLEYEGAKKKEFLNSTNPDVPFSPKNLNDIRYISKYITTYIKREMSIYAKLTNKDTPSFLTIKGNVTSMLRRNALHTVDNNTGVKTLNPWGLEDKVRDITHYHHTVDAMLLSQIVSNEELHLITFKTILSKEFNRFKRYNEKFPDDQKDIEKELNKIRYDLTKGIKKQNIYLSGKDKINIEYDSKGIQNNDINKNLIIFDNTFELTDLIPLKLKVIKEKYIPEPLKNLQGNVKKTIEYKYRYIPEVDRMLTPKEWTKEHKTDIHNYPYVSILIDKKLTKGSLFGTNPFSYKKALDENKKLKEGFFKTTDGSIYSIDVGQGTSGDKAGFDVTTGESVSTLEALQNIKNKENKTYGKMLHRNVIFTFENELYTYKGLSKKRVTMVKLYATSIPGNKKNKMVNKIIEDKNFKIVTISQLGILSN